MVERTILKPDSEEFKSLLEHHTSTNWDWCESAETVEIITRLQPIERGQPPVAALFQREIWFLNARHLFWYMPSFPTTETFAIRYANVTKYPALFTVKQPRFELLSLTLFELRWSFPSPFVQWREFVENPGEFETIDRTFSISPLL